MQSDFGALSVVPAVVAIAFALWKKRVLPALLLGILCAHAILAGPQFYLFPVRAVDHIVRTAANASNFGLILFSIMVGALLKLIRAGRGFEAMAMFLERLPSGCGRRTAFTLNFLLGGMLFIETWSNVLISGATLGPIYDRLRISRERLAYFIHTIGISVVSMILINTWGAFYVGLLSTQGIADPFSFAVRSVPFMLYGWCSLGLIVVVMLTGLSIGPMRAAERAAVARAKGELAALPALVASPVASDTQPRLAYFFLPIGALLITLLAALYITGDGELSRGDGTRAGVYAVLAATVMTALLAAIHQRLGLLEIEARVLSGMQEFLEVAVLIVFALTIGAACMELGTGHYIARLSADSMPVAALPALVFIAGAVMSFATGTSYGTFSIMVPIALPMAAATHLDPAMLFGACIAGGVFGDNCSPISDTSIVTGMGAGVAVIDHVQTQLPYALIAAGLAVIGYFLLGIAS